MSRTRRDVRFANTYARAVRHHAAIVAEHRAVDELREHGFHPRGRVLARAGKKAIPTNYDDLGVAAAAEVDYRGGTLRDRSGRWRRSFLELEDRDLPPRPSCPLPRREFERLAGVVVP